MIVKDYESLVDLILDNREKDFDELRQIVVDELEDVKPFNHSSNDLLEACGVAPDVSKIIKDLEKSPDDIRGSEIVEIVEKGFSKRELAVLFTHLVKQLMSFEKWMKI